MFNDEDVAMHPEKRIPAAAVRELCGGVSDMSIWRWIKREGFPKPASKIGGRRYWREAEVVEWLGAQAEVA